MQLKQGINIFLHTISVFLGHNYYKRYLSELFARVSIMKMHFYYMASKATS